MTILRANSYAGIVGQFLKLMDSLDKLVEKKTLRLSKSTKEMLNAVDLDEEVEK